MLNAVAPRVLRSAVALSSREFCSVSRPVSVKRQVVFLQDIMVDLHSSDVGLEGGKAVSKKDITDVLRSESVGNGPMRVDGAKLCKKSCAGCPRSAANSKLKNKVKVEEQLNALKMKEEKVEESGPGSLYGPTLPEDSFVARVSRTIDARFRTR